MRKVLSLMHNTSGLIDKIISSLNALEEKATPEQLSDKDFMFHINWARQKARRLHEKLDAFYLANPTDTACEDEVKKLKRLLEDLTPGGSEFYDDPQACFDFVKEHVHSFPKMLLQERRRRDAEIEKLKTAASYAEKVAYETSKANADLMAKNELLIQEVHALKEKLADCAMQLMGHGE